MSNQDALHHPKFPGNQPFSINGKPSAKRHWSKVRGHNNVKRGGAE